MRKEIRLSKYLADTISIGILFLFCLALFVANHNPNNWLVGWDNVLSEFDIGLSLKRSLFGAWAEHFGLGVASGFPISTELFRLPLLGILKLLFDISSIRYIWTFIMLFLGSVGTFLFTRYILHNKNNQLASVASATFYVFNLATLQSFFTPFETFVGFFAAIPWLLLSFLYVLRQRGRKPLLLFALTSLFFSFTFYVQTYFVVIFTLYLLLALDYISRERNSNAIKRSFGVMLLFIFVNAYWLLPTAYSTINNSSEIVDAKATALSTPETQLMNEAQGSFDNIVRLKGFWFEYTDYSIEKNQYYYLLPQWREWVSTPGVVFTGYGLFVISLIGILSSLGDKKSKLRLFPVALLLLSFVMLSSGHGLIGEIYKLFVNTIPLFGQVFRSVFTKWSLVMSFIMAIGIGFIVKKLPRLFSAILCIFVISGSIYSVYPMLSGNLISQNMQVDYPNSYLQLYRYLGNKSKQSRLAFFPIQTFWGWNFTNWNYRGSGFLWYGTEQPIMDRAFDIWSPYNETFYNELSTAYYKKDNQNILAIFNKYDISYVLLDESVIIPGGDDSQLRNEYTKTLLRDIGASKEWHDGQLTLYRLSNYSDSFVQPQDSYFKANFNDNYKRESIWNETSYVNGTISDIMYPFANISRENITDEVTYENEKVLFTSVLKNGELSKLTVPALNNTYYASADLTFLGESFVLDFEQPYSIYADEEKINTITKIPRLAEETSIAIDQAVFVLNGKPVEISKGESLRIQNIPLQKSEGLRVQIYDKAAARSSSLDDEFFSTEFNKCWERDNTEGEIATEIEDNIYKIEARDAVGCNVMKVGSLVKNAHVRVTLQFRSDNGARPHFCFQGEKSTDCLNSEVFYRTTTSKEFADVQREFVINEDDVYWLVVGGRPPDEKGEKWTIEYKAPAVTLIAQATELSFVPEVFSGLWSEEEVAIPKNINKIDVVLPESPIVLNNNLFQSNENKNCDILNRGYGEKFIRAGNIYYNSGSYGAACDFTSTDVSTQREYLMRIQGENQAGRSLKAFLYNQATQRNDLEVLMDEGKFDNTYSVLSWPQEENEYALSVETRSFGQLSRNRLDKVTFYDVPLTWLSQWRIGEPKLYHSALKVNKVDKLGTAFYKVDASGEGLLKLSQGYDKGWLAFSGGKLLEHVKVNGWANGWLIPSDYELRVTSYEVYIIFWPQLLQWFGFLLLVLTPIVIWHKIGSASR